MIKTNIAALTVRIFITGRIFAALFLAVFIFIFFPVVLSHAQEEESPEVLIEEQADALRSELSDLEKELESIHLEIEKNQTEKEGYTREINILDAQIRSTELQIRRNELVLNQVEFSIYTNQEIIETLRARIQKQKELLAHLVLSMYKLSDSTPLEIVLATDNLSEFFNDVQQVINLQEGLKGTLDIVKELKVQIEDEQIVLEGRVEDQIHILKVQELGRNQLSIQVVQKEVLEEESRSLEYVAREDASVTQRSINEIKNQLFVLSGGADAINFGQAYELAKIAESLTGVRPAFLLALIELESVWGANVGQCYLKNTETGEGIVISTGVVRQYVMKPMGMSGRRGDVDDFIRITQELGMDPFSTPISCPSAAYRGWGGAMGAAQFIPTTWMGYKDRITELVGSLANPWNIRDAFLASAIKLADAGAAARTYQKEFNAAMRYLSGGRWTHNEEHIYGEPIMNRAQQFQQDIDILENK